MNNGWSNILGLILNGPINVGNFNFSNSEDCFGNRKIFNVNIDLKYILEPLRFVRYRFKDGKIDKTIDDLGYYKFQTFIQNPSLVKTDVSFRVSFSDLVIQKCPAP